MKSHLASQDWRVFNTRKRRSGTDICPENGVKKVMTVTRKVPDVSKMWAILVNFCTVLGIFSTLQSQIFNFAKSEQLQVFLFCTTNFSFCTSKFAPVPQVCPTILNPVYNTNPKTRHRSREFPNERSMFGDLRRATAAGLAAGLPEPALPKAKRSTAWTENDS